MWHSGKAKTIDQWLPGFQGVGEEKDEYTEQREFLGQWNGSVHSVMVDTCHYLFVKTHRIYTSQRVNPNVNHGLQLKMKLWLYDYIL